jgi:hypothetical protein
MSVSVDFFVGPPKSLVLDSAALQALLKDLFERRIITPPWTLLTGEIDLQRPLRMTNVANGAEEDATIRRAAQGDDGQGLIAALSGAGLDEMDLCVCFPGLDWENDTLRAALEEENQANGDVVLYHLTQPRAVEGFQNYDEENLVTVEYRDCFAITGDGGPTELVDSPLREVLATHYGEDLPEIVYFA